MDQIKIGSDIAVIAYTRDADGVLKDADSTPTYAVWANGAAVLTGQTMTKVATGHYYDECTISVGNGFAVGDLIEIKGTATVDTIADSGPLGAGRVVAALAEDADTKAADIQSRLPAALTGDGNMKADTLRLGGTVQTGRDIGASVLLSSGTGTGQVKLSSGYVAPNWGDVGNPTTTVGLSGTTVKAVADGVNVTQLGGSSQSATDLKDFADTGYDPVTHRAESNVKAINDVADGVAGLSDLFANGYDLSDHKLLRVGTVDTASALGTTAKSEVNTEVAAALGTYDVPDNTDLNARTLPSADYATANVLAHVDDVADQIELDTQDIQSRLPAALTTDGNMKSDPQKLGGSQNGLDGIVDFGANGYSTATQSVNKVATVDALTANNDKTGYTLDEDYDAAKTAAQAGDAMALTSDERTTLAGVIWAAATSGLTTAGSIGKRIVDFVTTLVYAAAPTAAENRTEMDSNSSKLTSIEGLATDVKNKSDRLTFTVDDEVFARTTSVADEAAETIAVEVESHLLDEGDSQMLINAIVGAIGNTNIDQAVLVAAIRADLERSGGDLNALVARLTSTRAAYLDNLSGGAVATATAVAALPSASTIATAVWASGTRTLTSFGTLVADVWSYATRILTAGTNIVLAKGTGVTGFNDPTAAENAAAVRDVNNATPAANSLGAAVNSRAATGDAMTLAASEDVYPAILKLTVDGANDADEYTVQWFKNTLPVTSGITVPTIHVIKRVDGADLIATHTMTQIGSTGAYKYDAVDDERITAGEDVVAEVRATIDGSVRIWREVLGRDAEAVV